MGERGTGSGRGGEGQHKGLAWERRGNTPRLTRTFILVGGGGGPRDASPGPGLLSSTSSSFVLLLVVVNAFRWRPPCGRHGGTGKRLNESWGPWRPGTPPGCQIRFTQSPRQDSFVPWDLTAAVNIPKSNSKRAASSPKKGRYPRAPRVPLCPIVHDGALPCRGPRFGQGGFGSFSTEFFEVGPLLVGRGATHRTPRYTLPRQDPGRQICGPCHPLPCPHVHAPPGNALSLILQAFGRAMGGVGGGISRGSMNLGPGGRECHSELPPPRPWSGPSPLLPHLVVVETLLGWVAPPLPFSSGRHGGVGKGAE